MTLENLKSLHDRIISLQSEMWKKDDEYYQINHKYTFYITKEGKQLRAAIKSAFRDFYKAFDQYEFENNLIWKESKWINQYGCFEGYDNMEEARKSLLNHVSKLSGVKVLCGESGIKTVEINTRNKKYVYGIHARHGDGAYGCDLTFIDIYERDKLYEFEHMIGVR